MGEAADDHLDWCIAQEFYDLDSDDPDCWEPLGVNGPWHWRWGPSHRAIEAVHIKTGNFTHAAFRLGDQLKALVKR